MLQRERQHWPNPNGIWYQRNAMVRAEICLVNDQYRYEIFELCTGRSVALGSYATLAMAKYQALNFMHDLE